MKRAFLLLLCLLPSVSFGQAWNADSILKRVYDANNDRLNVAVGGTATVDTEQPAAGATTPLHVRGTDGTTAFTLPSTGQLPTALVGGRLDTAIGAALPAGEAFLGQVGAPVDFIDITLSLDTSAYTAGDVLADTQAITNAVRVVGGRAMLQSVTVIDEDDQGVAIDLFFLDTNNPLGAENAAPAITDAHARTVIGRVVVASGDYVDLGGARVATVRDIGLVLEATGASRDLYVAATTGGTPTHSAAGLKLRLGLVQY